MLLDEAQSSLIKETGKLRILVCYFVMRELIDDILRRPEKKTRVRLLQHTGVVIGIADAHDNDGSKKLLDCLHLHWDSFLISMCWFKAIAYASFRDVWF